MTDVAQKGDRRIAIVFRRFRQSMRNGNADNWRELYPRVTRIAIWTLALKLWFRNLAVRSAATKRGGPVVSLTSYGQRLDRVYLAIESIAAGEVLPGRIILWIAHGDASRPINRKLKRLQKRGLDIRFCPDYRSHKKYYPFSVEESANVDYMVTADDDVMYARWWLKELVRAFELQGGNAAVGYRVLSMRHTNGVLAPYLDWNMKKTREPDALGVITGVSGAVYPKVVLQEAVRRGTVFTNAAPSADDLWLARLSMDVGIPRAQVFSVPKHFWSIPGTQNETLMKSNWQSVNDAVARDLFAKNVLADFRWTAGIDDGKH